MLCSAWVNCYIIAKNGEHIEVLEPLWLRNKIADKIKGMWNKYNPKDDI